MRSLVKLYDKALEWSQHRLAPHYLAAVSFVEASVFPIPPYFMLAPMALAKPHKALHYAFIATVASVLGGTLGYLLGMLVFNPIILPILEYFNYVAKYEQIVLQLQSQGFWAVLVAGFTPLPFKLVAIASGFMRIPLYAFLLGSLFGRALKFYAIAIVIKFGGSKMEQKIRKLVEKLGLVMLIVAAGVAVFALSGCAKLDNKPKEPPKRVKTSPNVNRLSTQYTRHDKNIAKETKTNTLREKTDGAIGKLNSLWGGVAKKFSKDKPKSKEKGAATKSKTFHEPVAKKSNPVIEKFKHTVGVGKSSDWVWPTQGAILSSFDSNKKGIDIAGKEGNSILAANAGEVVYSGNALRGYGNLIIVKHPNNYLTAYAHNRKNLVKEGEKVTRGQKIAEMGRTGAESVKLHFEVRNQGKPVDPARVLPKK